MIFLIDAQLPPLLAEALQASGYDAVHVADLGLLAASDGRIWDEATARSAILLTKDRDFTLLRAARHTGPTVVWIRLGNLDNKTLIARVLRAMPKLKQAVDRGDTIIELTN